MKYWWTNHTESSRQELTGGYLWNPRSLRGLTRAAPGDMIVSYAATLVTHVGAVADYASAALNPISGQSLEQRKNVGWLLPVQWQRLRYPVRPKSHIVELAQHLSARTNPLDPVSGSSNPAVRFARISADLYNVVLSHSGDIDVSELAVPFSLQSFRERLESSLELQIKNDANLDSTVKLQSILARRGQGEFRRAVAVMEPSCRLTGVDNYGLLIASHIKPWRSCETAAERLDGNNGLFLAPHVDWLFDKGLLTFLDDGTPIASELVTPDDLDRLGLAKPLLACSRPFSSRQASYLSHHRDYVFLK